jgi:hypothetical protein
VPRLWHMGFLAGMRLRMGTWEPLPDVNRVDHRLMLPILLYCLDPVRCFGPPREGPKWTLARLKVRARGNVASFQELLIGDGLDVGYSTSTH